MSNIKIDQSNLLAQIPDGLRLELIKSFNEILRNYREQRWGPSELNGGKLCEVAYTILRGHIDGSFPSRPSKPRNMVDACRALEQEPASAFPRSIRIQIPRMIIALYEIRNNRGVSHVGGDVDPNQMDANAVLYMSKWIVAELVRIFHDVDTETAMASVNSIVERIIPIVWQIGERRRVLDPGLKMKEKVLVLLYHHGKPIEEATLFDWVEHTNASVFRRDVLRKAHREKLIEYDEDQKVVYLSPLGVQYVEEKITGGF